MIAAAHFCGLEAVAVRVAVRGGSLGEVVGLAVFGSFFLLMFAVVGYQTAVEAQRKLEVWRREHGWEGTERPM